MMTVVDSCSQAIEVVVVLRVGHFSFLCKSIASLRHPHSDFAGALADVGLSVLIRMVQSPNRLEESSLWGVLAQYFRVFVKCFSYYRSVKA
jgi:hypothetical protein